MVAKIVPHGIVEVLIFFGLEGAGRAGGDGAVHDGIKAAASGDQAVLEGIHVEIADKEGALVTFLALQFVDDAGEVNALVDLAFLAHVELAGEVGGGEDERVARRQGEAADGGAMALIEQRHAVTVEADEDHDASAVAAGVLVIGLAGVEAEENDGVRDDALGEDEDIDVVFEGNRADQARDVAAVQVPEKELHSRRVAEWGIPGGAGAESIYAPGAARLKSCPDTRRSRNRSAKGGQMETPAESRSLHSASLRSG